MSNQYAERDIMELDRRGGHYRRHVSAMTGESLHDKSDIAAELAYRDVKIEQLQKQLTNQRDCAVCAEIERDELAAHVERLRERRAETLEQDCHEIIDQWLEANLQSSLARRDLIKQAEALESAYEDGDPSTIWSILSVRAQDLRQKANQLEIDP